MRSAISVEKLKGIAPQTLLKGLKQQTRSLAGDGMTEGIIVEKLHLTAGVNADQQVPGLTGNSPSTRKTESKYSRKTYLRHWQIHLKQEYL